MGIAILFILKLYIQINISRYNREKYSQEMIRLAKKLEKSNAKIAKVKCDIKLSLFCKNNNLTLIFTRPKFAIRLSNYLRNKILRQISETEIRNQHVKKKKLTRQMKENTNNISNNTSFICNIVLYNSIKNTVPKENVDGTKFTTRNWINYILKEDI